MMISLQAYTKRSRYRLRQLLQDPNAQLFLRASAYVVSGFCLSAASLNHLPLPLAMALTAACTGWAAVLSGIGSILGYLAFWGSAGYQCVWWVAAGLLLALLLGEHRLLSQTPLLLPAFTGLIVSATGVVFQTWFLDTTPVGDYLLRVSLGVAAPWLFRTVLQRRNPLADWLCCGLGMLALCQLVPFPGFSLGFVAAGALAVVGAFPAAAVAGVAMDLSGICAVPMTAVLCGSYLVRFLPRYPRWFSAAAPAGVYLLVSALHSVPAIPAFLGMLAGGALGILLPAPTQLSHRRGETGLAQVRLELVASVLAQTEQLLLEAPQVPIDEDALIARAAEEACHSCPCRKTCKDTTRLPQLPAAVLHKPLVSPEELPIVCRKSGRLLAQLHRAQEHLRWIQGDRQRQQEYRTAVVQQYGFLSEYLQELSDSLCRKADTAIAAYVPNVQIYANRPMHNNGDRCIMFPGTKCRYYVVLCDGMGNGPGAMQEAKSATEILRRLLSAGYPARYALRSLNSLCALRSRAGIVTIELLEIGLDTGKATLYKWGAAPSYLISGYGAEKIGTAGPPPGLSLNNKGEMTYQLSLRRGELLLLVSDGIGQTEALNCCLQNTLATPGELARNILTFGQRSGEDDATVVTVNLSRRHYEQQ